MAGKLNKAAYQKLIDEDIKAVRDSNCEPLEREHIVDVLRHSVECYYPEKRPDQLKAFEEWAAVKFEQVGTSHQEQWTGDWEMVDALRQLPRLISKYMEQTAPTADVMSYSHDSLRPGMQGQI